MEVRTVESTQMNKAFLFFLMQMNGVQTGWGRWWVYIMYNAFDSGRLSQAGHQEIKCGKHNICIKLA